MKAKAFIDSMINMLSLHGDMIEYMYNTPESKFLYTFRARHYGEYHDITRGIDRHRTWVMMQTKNHPKIRIDITNISCSFNRTSALAICNRIIDEINDVMISRFGKNAILIDHVYDPRIKNIIK